MSEESKRSDPGLEAAPRVAPAPGLHLVATPIGHARDITLRALDVLAGADAIAAEDTRRTRKLLQIHGIALGTRPLVSYHDQNGAARRPQILGWLAEGFSVALCSDAGTPLVADPGYRLARDAIAAGHAVTAVPGPSAALAALSLSGLPSDRFLFAGFLPQRRAARRAALAELAPVPATLVLFESPRRVADTLADAVELLGDRDAAVARELTKRYEEVRRGPLSELSAAAAAAEIRGEVALVIGPPSAERAEAAAEAALDDALAAALAEESLKDAVRRVSLELGLPRRRVYARALEIAGP